MAAVEVPQTLEYRGGQLNAAPILEVEKFTNWKKRFMYHIIDFQDSPDDEEDTRSSHEYLNNLEEEYQARALLAKSKRFFKKGTQRFISAKATDQTKCHKCGKKGHFARDCWSKTSVPSNQSPFQSKSLSSSASASKASTIKNKGLIDEAYELDEEEVSSDDNVMVEVKVLMALAKDNDAVSKEGARNGEWVKISMRKIHTLLEMEDNDDRKTYLDYFEQIPSQKKRVLGVDQLTEDPSSYGQKYLVFVKSSVDDTKVSIPGVERPWLSKAEGFILPNHDTGRILPPESQRNTTDPSVAVTDSSATEYDSADESLVCSTPLPPLKKLDGVEPISRPKTIKSILRSKSTFKAETLKGVIINEPSSALAKDNKSSSASKVNSAPAGKLKSVKIEVDPPLDIVIKELNNLKLQFSKSQSSYSRSNQPLQVPHNTLQNTIQRFVPIRISSAWIGYKT
ncbi:retrovirus-related pol polyprotein from transposon TNT 1-94 [Tanacetum coccineum]|uniref:Retrovirus-related pol polyprotein from transposon TNT 1-94 n=1 Tax=Tanacetum coccineum TaxID=301880 RepID=A0ABQ4YUZ0_9ASTR